MHTTSGMEIIDITLRAGEQIKEIEGFKGGSK
jgi:hypothetical protein